MDDQNVPNEPVAEAPVQAPEPAPTHVEPESGQPKGSKPADLPPEAPESFINDLPPIPVESQNGAVNEPESVPEEPQKEPQIEAISASPVQSVSVPAPQTSVTSQLQSLAQQDQHGFIHALLLKAQTKIQFNKQKKSDKIIQFAQKNKIITNDDVQKLLRVSDATSTRYLVKLVRQGRLARVGNPRDAKYQFLR